jgi:acyl carrier protein
MEEARLPDTEQTVLDTIRMLLRRKRIDVEIGLDSEIDTLGLESLDVAELSAILEDELGRDPWSADYLPRTVGQIVEWYKS